MNVVFDTNAYRLFCDRHLGPLKQEQKQQLLYKLRQAELSNDMTPCLNHFVLAELLKHLVSKTDPAYYRCLQAIQVTYWHTLRDSAVNFYPPPEIEICNELFGLLPSSFTVFMERLGTLYFEIIADSSDEKILGLKPAFKEMDKWLADYKKSFIDSYSNYLNSEDPLNAFDWKILIEDRNKRKETFNSIRKQQRRVELAIGLILFIGKHLDFPVALDMQELIGYAEQVQSQRPLGFELMMRIVELFHQPQGYNLSTSNRPNDVIDFLFALSLDTSKSRILVSEDSDLHRAANEIGITDKVLKLDIYLLKIGFI